MAKFIFGAAFMLSLMGRVCTSTLGSEHIMNVPTFAYHAQPLPKKIHHYHVDFKRILPNIGNYLRGIASWYGPGFQGARTASGARFDTYSPMCAMRYVRLGTWVTITNLNNGVSARCQIMDRGPFVPGRIIDLSHAVKLALHMSGGTAPVSIRYY